MNIMKIIKYNEPKNTIDFFNQAMFRFIEDIKKPIEGVSLNLGAGIKDIGISIPLQYPEWNAEKDPIPYPDNSISNIYAYHFFEHIENLIPLLRECQRVLINGGLMFICVPYYKSEIAFLDLDHKRYFTEKSWENLFRNEFYNKDKEGWQFKEVYNMIIGLKERHLCLLTQLEKTIMS